MAWADYYMVRKLTKTKTKTKIKIDRDIDFIIHKINKPY